ncbi:MAG: SUMF1/EgtB/PvdO family nonheme iron enzyme [Patescibacteria group bacterium]|nr:SUMF1/EgtB/PvdO family nonheme iron enzyme [Patescibacteria group bacterium]
MRHQFLVYLIAPLGGAVAALVVMFGSPEPSRQQDAGQKPPPTDAPSDVSDDATAPAPKQRCPSGMKLVSGVKYCPRPEFKCIDGYVCDKDAPGYKLNPKGWCKKFPNEHAKRVRWPAGRVDIEYCEEFLEGYAECGGTSRPVVDFCIDQYEFPNQVGVKPAHGKSWHDMKNACEAEGKRLCRDDEWTVACQGPTLQPFPQGWKRQGNCNVGHDWVPPEQISVIDSYIEPSGARPNCVSPFGVADLTGNVDEWVVNTSGKPYVSGNKGGHPQGLIRNRCDPMTTAHGPGSVHPVFGGRCCADPDAAIPSVGSPKPNQ